MYPKCLIFASIDRTSFVGLQLHTLQEEGMLVVGGGGVKNLEGCQIQTERAATHKISQNRLAGQALIFFHGYSGGIIPDL